jgi:hypothetical protein
MGCIICCVCQRTEVIHSMRIEAKLGVSRPVRRVSPPYLVHVVVGVLHPDVL